MINLHGVKAIYRFELARWFRTLMQSILAPVISTSLYFVVFGSAIGSRMTTIDGVSYGAAPKEGTWKDIFLNEVKDRLDLTRVHFTGKVPYDHLVDLLHVSRAHAYLTYPFVLSWSMVETLAAGTLVVASNTAPVAEVIKDGVNGRLVDFFDVKGWSAALTDALARPEAYDGMRQAAQQMARERYDLKTVCLPKQIELLTRLARS